MKLRQFEGILKSGEGTLIEFKKKNSAGLGREISAFANTAGGRLFIGIDDNNNVIGCKFNNKIKSQIQDIANNCNPRISIFVESILYKDKEIVVVTVPENTDKPVQCSEGFFLREGANSQKMTRDEIFDDRVEISNPGELLFEKEKFGKKSVARNPIIFDIFNRLGLVEKVGSGIKRIISVVMKRNLEVAFDIDSFFTIIFQRPNIDNLEKEKYKPRHIDKEAVRTLRKHPPSTPQVPPKYPPSTPQVLKALSFCETPRKRDEIQKHLALNDRKYFRLNVLNPLLEDGLLEPLIPGKPRSPKQKYIITEKGKKLLEK